MCRLALAALLGFAACVARDESAEGDHLIVHITSTVGFDHVLVSSAAHTRPFLFDNGIGDPVQAYDWDHWEVFNGEGPRALSVTVIRNGITLATADATSITYHPAGDGSMLAEITLPVDP